MRRVGFFLVGFGFVIVVAAIVFFLVMSGCAGSGVDAPGEIDGAGNNLVEVAFVNGDSLSRDTIDLGRIHQGEVVSGGFVVRNDTDLPLSILRMKSDCGCTRLDFRPGVVAVGGVCDVGLSFDSRGMFGVQYKVVEVEVAEVASSSGVSGSSDVSNSSQSGVRRAVGSVVVKAEVVQ